MKIISFGIVLLLHSCNGQENKNLALTNEAVIIMEKKYLSYNDWVSSMVKSIKSDTLIQDYERSNIIGIIDNITKEKYLSLQYSSEKIKNDENFNEIFILQYSNGEVVESNLYYLFSNNFDLKKSCLKISKGTENIGKSISLPQKILKEISVLPISSNNIYQNIILLTEIKNGKIVTKLGNPNKALANILIEK